MKQAICNYHRDEHNDWVAELECGHYQHVRHKPPFFNRPWVETIEGRNSMLGRSLSCIECQEGKPNNV